MNRGLACIALGGLLPLAALGHAKLLSTVPAMGEQLAVAPKRMTLQFNEAVQIGVLKLSADGKDIPIELGGGTAAAGAAPAGTAPASASAASTVGASTVTVELPALAPATYRVQWSALTVDDGHVVKGTFSFVVVAGAR
jgi:methionine-rich copper-binding protein CopC